MSQESEDVSSVGFPREEVLFHDFHARNDACEAEKAEIGVLADYVARERRGFPMMGHAAKYDVQ